MNKTKINLKIKEIGEFINSKGLKLAIAESCTGGLISSYFTDVSGASSYIENCFVVYSESAKNKILGVKPETLEENGVISEAVALEMLEGLKERHGADYAISTTGILGPDDILFKDKLLPKGLVFIGLMTPNKTTCIKYISNYASREEVKVNIVCKAIQEFHNFISK
ncbi:CinA family protein [bacterium]|nr:CinA family protein [bacterium]